MPTANENLIAYRNTTFEEEHALEILSVPTIESFSSHWKTSSIVERYGDQVGERKSTRLLRLRSLSEKDARTS